MSQPFVLNAIKYSASTQQYRIPAQRPSKFYKPAFVLSPEDRDKTIKSKWFRKTDPLMPPYPYGRDLRYPEANEGLYGGMSIRSGNKISKGRNKGKTLRKWFPNIRVERIKSNALDRELTIPIASRVMRTIKKVGGLDQYLTGEKPARIKELGILGWKLRWMVLNSQKFKAQYEKEQKKLDLPTDQQLFNPLQDQFETAWNDKDPETEEYSRRMELIDKQIQKWEALREKDERFKKHYLRNVLADNGELRIPDISTLSFYDPGSLRLDEAEVETRQERIERNKQERKKNRMVYEAEVGTQKERIEGNKEVRERKTR